MTLSDAPPSQDHNDPARSDPGCLSGLLTAAVRHHQAGQMEAAHTAYARILSVDPGHGLALHLQGVLTGTQGDPAGAIRLMCRARRTGRLVEDGNLAAAFANLAARRQDSGAAGAAESCLTAVIALNPADARIWSEMGALRTRAGRFGPASLALGHALALQPGFAGALGHRGDLALRLGSSDEAIVCLERSLELHQDVAVHRSLLLAILYSPLWSEEARFAERRRFATWHAPAAGGGQPRYSADSGQPGHVNVPDPDRRLRIGYLTADFWHHPVARNMEPLVRGGDRARAGTFIYALGQHRDTVSERFRTSADVWRDVAGRSDADLAATIRGDGIDILVVLAGHFADNRPLVAAYRPAPVQVSLHDGATSGLETMDYLLTDRHLAPRGGPERFTERLVRLPVFYAHDLPDDAPPVTPAPPMIANGFVTFGSLNNPSKLNDEVLALWARVLRAVPESRLLLKYRDAFADPLLRQRIAGALARHGVDPARLILPPAAIQIRRHHLALYRDIDIGLDPFPFGGATTTFEALLMGVPVLALPGSTMMSRTSAAFLMSLGCGELIATTADEYVALAAGLAADGRRLAALRAGLRQRLATSPLCNGPARARHFHRALRAMWRRWCTAQGAGAQEQAHAQASRCPD
jgi:predicted O-linked N-acetylglucosamine transferase (SPINDLY family)